MSGTLSVNERGATVKIVRKNTLQRRGHFAGQEIIDSQRNHMEPEELQRFFKSMPKRSIWYPYFFIQYFYGCRLSEPALILDEDVDFKKGQIIIKRLKKKREEAGYQESVYAADSRVLEAVQTALDWKVALKEEANPFLFPSKKKTEKTGAERLSQLRHLDGFCAVSRFTAHRMFQRVAQQAKLPERLHHSHVLRHTRATLLLASGMAPEQVQHLLGHSSLRMTQRYLGIAESMRHKMSTELLQQGAGFV
jgi:integrase